MFRDDMRWAAAAATGTGSTRWTREEDLRFEQALAEGLADWEAIARQLPGKTAAEVAAHYRDLVYDVEEIDAGRVEPPSYDDDAARALGSLGWDSAADHQISFGGGKGTKHDPDRKKGTPWTENEHRLFLKGLRLYGKGDWRSISRNIVVTRTPTQVASHAQKYFLRQGSGKKERKRSSIHDITTADAGDTAVVPVRHGHGQDNRPPEAANNPPPLPLQQQLMAEFHPQLNHHPNQPTFVSPVSQVGPMDYQNYGFPM